MTFWNDTPLVALGFQSKHGILQMIRALPNSKSDEQGPDRHGRAEKFVRLVVDFIRCRPS
jgi:hypothetical protein